MTGTVSLNGATLGANLWNGFTPTVSQTFTIINNDGADAVSGTFAGLAEGATVTLSGVLFTVSYTGGTGNDVVLTRLAGPNVGVPVLLKDINPGSPNSLSTSQLSFVDVGGTTFFAADDGATGTELWKTDGTAAGTVLVKDIFAGTSGAGPTLLTNVSGTLFFSATDGIDGREVWRSDGTAAGTFLVEDINPGAPDSAPGFLVNMNGSLFFAANDGANGAELWKSDGTAAGTVLVLDIATGTLDSAPGPLSNLNGTLVFSAIDAINGREVWKSDGTAAGTVLLKDINPGSVGSLPAVLPATAAGGSAIVGGIGFFQANDGTNGYELWKTDGTAAGTVLVKDVRAGASSGNPYVLTNINGTLFFRANDGTSGIELWKSDGTTAGTVLVKDVRPGVGSSLPVPVNVNGTVFFSANDGTTGIELWKSDGTTAGTVLVSDINGTSTSSSPSNLTNVVGTLFFSADNGTAGSELWKSDGTAGGTVLVLDIRPGALGSSPARLTNVSGALFFAADDGTNGVEPWLIEGAMPTVTLSPATVLHPEGNAGTTDYVFTVSLSAASGQTVTVAYATTDDTATTSNSDYMAASGTLTFAPSETEQLITVLVNGDTRHELDEAFTLALSSPTNATLGLASAAGTIQNDDPLPSLSLSPTTVSHPEGNELTTAYLFTVSLSAASGLTTTVVYSTANGTATLADGDYGLASGTLTFAPGQTAKVMTVLVNGDTRNESDESFVVNLSSPNGATLGTSQANGTIINDDSDHVHPYVLSINRTNPAGATAPGPSVVYTVTFNEPVTGVDPPDFSLALSGVTATTPVAVSGSGASYTVTISGITGSGTLGLNLVDDNTIRDANGNALIQQSAPASFGAVIPYPAGNSPNAVVPADLNGDGKIDIVVANLSDDTVSVLLGLGDGTFGTQTTFAAGNTPRWAAGADFNNDGKLDIVTANFDDNQVSVLLGNGDGTFGSPTAFAAGTSPIRVTAADINSDGKPDLLVANSGVTYVSVLLGNGNGTFPAPSNVTVGSSPQSVAVTDLNGDGKQDLVTANYLSQDASVVLGNGNGTFGSPTSYPTGGGIPAYALVADVNGDGKGDLIVADFITSEVKVRLGNGDGTFAAQTTFADTGSTTVFVAVADINGDGKADLITANSSGDTLDWMLGDGNGTFATRVMFPIGATPRCVVVADLNGDSRLDLISDNVVALNNADGSFTGQVYTIEAVASVVATRLFYKGSTKWNVTNGATFSDDNAIAPDKTAYLPGSGTSTFSAVSSYNRGINGLMVDISGPHGVLTASDFIFKNGRNNSPSLWATATAPTSVTTRAGAGTGGSDRIELLWANNAVQKLWLEVVVKGNDTLGGSNTNTGLPSSYVFYFGNGLADVGQNATGPFQTTSADEVYARNNPTNIALPATRSNIADFDRNGQVNSADQIIARNNTTSLTTQLNVLLVGGGGPFAPESSSAVSSNASPENSANESPAIATSGASPTTSSSETGIASGLAATSPGIPSSSGSSSSSGPGLPGWLDLRLESLASAASGVSAPMLDAASLPLDKGDDAVDDGTLEDDLLDLLVSATD